MPGTTSTRFQLQFVDHQLCRSCNTGAAAASDTKVKRSLAPDNPAAPTLTREGYYTSPPLRLLRRLGDGQLAALERFVIGREDTGEVQFLQVRLMSRYALQVLPAC